MISTLALASQISPGDVTKHREPDWAAAALYATTHKRFGIVVMVFRDGSVRCKSLLTELSETETVIEL